MQKTCALLDPQLGAHWDTHSILNGAGCLVWTAEWSSWVSVERGNLYHDRPPSQAGQVHPATEKESRLSSSRCYSFLHLRFACGKPPSLFASRLEILPFPGLCCPLSAPAGRIPRCGTDSIVGTSLRATTTRTLCPCNLQGC